MYFVDAAHFVVGGFAGWLWCLVRWWVPTPAGRKRYNVLAALDALTQRIVRVCNETTIGAPSVCELLTALRQSNPMGWLTVVLDNARYQRCRLVQEKAAELGIELMYLPPY